ncbi:DinB family protein [Brevibacillus dissolubilis]|uniref:DinB family protein n=1 Tax=Brevibacillus dissolubilis TaxID=1844116 RepID=UPI001116EECD|nr:DinB family protein [Brevibacillus dissolubilis]
MSASQEVLFNQLEFIRKATLGCVEGVTAEQADIIPAGYNNNIRWNLGHIYLDQFLWLQHLTKEPAPIPEGYRDWFNYQTSPADFTSDTPSLDELKELLAGQIQIIRETYANRLDEEFPATELGMHTVGQVLVRTVFHEGIHIGAMAAIRRQL